jgi:uroporphyrinogen-III decarboxylase
MSDAGLDALNPVQTSAAGMDPRWLKETYGGRLTYWGGGVETQSTLPFGTPEEVSREVAERLKVFGPGGGFVFCPIHNIQADTPPENIVAAYETARELGTYRELP